jgi:hypothetical protein
LAYTRDAYSVSDALAEEAAVGGGEVGEAAVKDGGKRGSVGAVPQRHDANVGKGGVGEGASECLDNFEDSVAMRGVGFGLVIGAKGRVAAARVQLG